LQSTILIGQVNIPSWGQRECTRVPRPFLLCEGCGSETILGSGLCCEHSLSIDRIF